MGDQETKKISASQLAEVLAAVDARAAARDDRPTAPPPADADTSGARAVVSVDGDDAVPAARVSSTRAIVPDRSGKFAAPPKTGPTLGAQIKEVVLFLALVVFAVISVSMQR